MDILMLGGTSFVGRAIVEDLLSRGHTPTIFSRGRTGPELFPGVERLRGDRDANEYAALTDRRWDAVVDVCAYVPRHVQQAVAALGAHTGRYLFISTGLVYDRAKAGEVITEDSPCLPAYRMSEEIDDDTYGPLKVACEDDLRAHFGDLLTVVRPGWVVGPHERTDRLVYLIRKAERGGPVAIPTRPDRPVQLLDVRDLARLVVRLLEQDQPGTYNAVGPAHEIDLAALIEACGVLESVEVPDDDLDFPFLLPDASWDVLFHISAAAAHGVGMPQTSLAETIADTRAWDHERGQPALSGWMSEDEEAGLLVEALNT